MNTFAMSRKLHNTISALMVSGAVLVLGLTAAHPAGRPSQDSTPQSAIVLETPTRNPAVFAGNAADAEALALQIEARANQIETLADATAFTTELATAAALAETAEEASAAEPAAAQAPHRKSGKSSRIRQSMAMPYFSFVSRG